MPSFRLTSRFLLAGALAATLGIGVTVSEEPLTGSASAAASATTAHASRAPQKVSRRTMLKLRKSKRARLRAIQGVEFGIYPGGGAGAVNGRGEPRPEIPELRLAALQQLRGSEAQPFAVHLYDAYTGPADADAVPAWLDEQIADYTAAGMRVELVLRYRPRGGADVPGFTDFVRARVAQLGPNPNVIALQVTNEANVQGAPDAADGAYGDAMRALTTGVVAAKREVARLGYAQLAIGFNVADDSAERLLPFFKALRRTGGRTFTRAVDWVGVDAYPGTWGPALPSGDLDAAVRSATRQTVDRFRRTLLPAAGLATTPLQFAESGYPTDHGGRSEADQVTVMRAAIETVVSLRRSRGLMGYRWFDLRDADSAVDRFESQYGLMRDDYSPKAGFDVYRSLVARYG